MDASPPRPAEIPYAIAFWDAQTGLLGTGRCPGARLGSCERGAIERTGDGGRAFQVVFRTPRPVLGLQTAGPRGAIATTDEGRYRTLDGGRTWQRWPGGAEAVSFATANVGMSVSASAMLMTRDGGRTWQRRTSPCRQAVAFGALLDLVTLRRGWLVCLGQPGAGNEEKAAFRTRDGGVTWQAVHGSISEYGYPQGISFAADGFGLLWESRGTLYVTRDGGARWHAEPHTARPEVDFGRGGSAFGDGRAFVLLGHGGGLPARLLETQDRGRTWHTVHRWSG